MFNVVQQCVALPCMRMHWPAMQSEQPCSHYAAGGSAARLPACVACGRHVLACNRKSLRFVLFLDNVLVHSGDMYVARLPNTSAAGVLRDAVAIEDDVKVGRGCIDLASGVPRMKAGNVMVMPAKSCISCTYLVCTSTQGPSLGAGLNAS
jgi:hypothetical protein